MIPVWMFGIALLLGLIFVFEGFKEDRVFMAWVGSAFLLILGFEIWLNGIPYVSGVEINESETGATVNYINSFIKNDTTNIFAIALVISGLYGIIMPIADQISPGKKGKWFEGEKKL